MPYIGYSPSHAPRISRASFSSCISHGSPPLPIHSFIHPTAFHLAWVSLWGYFSKQTVFWSGGGRWHPSILWSQVSASVTCSLVSTFSLPRLPEAHVEQSLPLGWLLCHGTPGAFFIAFNNPENPLACLCYYYLCLCYYLHLLSIFLYHGGIPTRTWISLILFPIVSLTPVCLTSSRNPRSWMNDSRNKWTDRQQPTHLAMPSGLGRKCVLHFPS